MNQTTIVCLAALMISGCQCGQQNEATPEMALEENIISTAPDAKYMIVAGAYRQREFAERKIKDLGQKGYPASIINYKGGLLAVVICPSDDLDATMKKLEELRGTDVCPQDAWILENK